MISIDEIDEANRDFWDAEIARFDNAHPLNAYGWGKVRAIDGWLSTSLLAKRGSSVTGAALLLTKRISLSGLSIMYVPRGPIFNLHDHETLASLIDRIREEAKKRHSIFVRIDPNLTENEISNAGDPFRYEGFLRLPNRWSMWNAPRDVFRIDLNKSANEDALFMSLDRQARKAVRNSRKRGVIIQQATSLREFEIFYKIFKQFTIERGFMSRGYAYQKCLWDEFITRGNGTLFLAHYEGQIIGGILCLIFADKCLAMHMGTPRKYQHLRPNDAYVWEAIKWAKRCRCQWFSFRGVGSSITEKRFKKKFGPDEVPLAGYYDLPFYPSLYRLLHNIEMRVIPGSVHIFLRSRRMWIDLNERLRNGLLSSPK